MSDFNNLTEADHQTTKALWHEAKATVRLQGIRIRELEAKVAVYECNAFYQSGYHAATAVSEDRIRELEAALARIADGEYTDVDSHNIARNALAHRQFATIADNR